MKIEDQVLPIKQAMNLQELGLDMSDAAHFWCSMKLDSRGNLKKKRDWFVTLSKAQMHCGMMVYEYIPTYTLQEVLNKLPEEIITNYGRKYKRHIDYDTSDEFTIYYSCWGDFISNYYGDNPLEVAYNALCRILENGYLKEEIK